jgi:hypothetical protein
MADTQDGAAMFGVAAPDDRPGGQGASVAPTPPGPDATPGLSSYYLTFGVGYEDFPHPRGDWIHPDGWVTVVAPSYHAARVVVVGLFGWHWSDIYEAEHYESGALDVAKFPRGELMRIVIPAGLIETEDHRV